MASRHVQAVTAEWARTFMLGIWLTALVALLPIIGGVVAVILRTVAEGRVWKAERDERKGRGA